MLKFKNRWQDLSVFQDRKAQIVAGVFTRTSSLMIQLQSYVVQNKLSGNPLHRVTGVLASSVHAVPTKVEGEKIIGAVEAAGGPAWYGKVHETGGLNPFDILPTRKRVLRFMRNGEEIFAKVVHHPPLPARPFMEPSLDEMKAQIIAEIQRAFDDALRD